MTALFKQAVAKVRADPAFAHSNPEYIFSVGGGFVAVDTVTKKVSVVG